MTDKEHAEMLAKFFTTLFGPDERVYIYPTVTRDRDQFAERINDLNEIVGGRQVKYEGHDWDNTEAGDVPELAWKPIFQTKPFTRKASATGVSLIADLTALSAVGYEIYFSINPLTDRKRCQKTVRQAYHVLLECDEMPPDDQMEIFGRHKDVFSAITFSGGKSMHALLKLDPPPWNDQRVDWRVARDLGDGDTRCEWAEYDAIAEHWIEKLKAEGLVVDPRAAKDFSRVSRVPGFPHARTGNVAEIKHLNADAAFSLRQFRSQRDWQEDFACVLTSEESNGGIDLEDDDEQLSSDYCDNGDWIDDIVSDNGPLRSSGETEMTPLVGNGPKVSIGDVDVVVCPVVNTATTNVMHFREPRSSFLDDLETYERLRSEGIPARHERINLHPIMFRAARILAMDRESMAAEWRRIVSLHPESIGCSADYAVADLLREHDKGKRCGIYLPDCTRLPDLDSSRIKALRQRLKQENCLCIHGVYKIIQNVLWDQIRKLPRQCMTGELGIRSRDLQAAYRNYKKPFGWMQDARLVLLTDDLFISGRKTRSYWVNIPLVLYWLGFKTGDLTWSKVSASCSWEEIAA